GVGDFIGSLGRGLRGEDAQGKVTTRRDAMGKVIREEQAPSRIAQVGAQIGQGAQKAGKALLDAIKPAAPIFKGLILPALKEMVPMLKDLGTGIAIAFTVGVRVLKAFANIIGTVGKVFQAIPGPVRTR